MKITQFKKEAYKIIKRDAHSFPVGMQFAHIMMEDKYQSRDRRGSAAAENKNDDMHSPLYKQISRFINPDLL